jgi:predicted RNA-binding protein YlxR (DUF448 family)
MARVQHLESRTAQAITRTCAGCGAKKPQREMLRIASQNGDVPKPDFEWKLPGRGAYLCPNPKCAQTAFTRRALERTLKLNNSLSPSAREEIERALGAGSLSIRRQNDTNENGKGGLR